MSPRSSPREERERLFGFCVLRVEVQEQRDLATVLGSARRSGMPMGFLA